MFCPAVQGVFVQIVGIVVFGLAIWVLADAPQFMDLFEKVRIFHSLLTFVSRDLNFK